MRWIGEAAMATSLASADVPTASAPSLHPLEPLSGEEIAAAVALLRAAGRLSERSRIVLVVLHEPPKDVVLEWQAGSSVAREAEIQILDNADGAVYEAVVSLTEGGITSWRQVPGAQPAVMLDEFFECEAVLKADPEFQA